MPAQEPEIRAVAATPSAAPRYRVGTLAYTRGTLGQVMFWMLWGDFFFQLMESMPPSVIPLQLRWEGAGDTLIGLLATSLPSALGFFLGPVVGMKSDRHRGWLGRRRPFLLWCTPPVVISLVLLGAAKPGGAMLQRVLSAVGGTYFTVAGCTIAWIGLCIVVFLIFNTFIAQVYEFLFADVIPQEVMGKFIGIYRAVGAMGSLAFNRWALGWVQAYTLHIYSLIAILYAGAFFLIVWKVKEGDYPPPPPQKAGGGLEAIKRYCKECFTHRLYLNVYCVPFFFWSSLVPFSFVVFFATQAGKPGYASTLGLTLQEFGQIKGWTFFVQIPIFFLVGPLVDRFHPLRVAMVGLFLTSVTYFCCFWLVHGAASLQFWWCLNQAAIAVYLAAYLTILPRLLPLSKYGQFMSANQTFGYIGLVLTPPLCGLLLETIRDYRYVFIFCGISTGLACLACVTLFLQWKRLGGDEHYRPPEPWLKSSG